MKNRSIFALIAICALSCVCSSFAFAATNSTTIDLVPLVSPMIENVLGFAGTLALAFLARKFKIDGDASLRELVDTAIHNGLNYAEHKIGDKAKVDLKNVLVKHAAEYVLKHIPTVLKRLGIDETGLKNRILARMMPENNKEIGFDISN